MKGLKSLKTKGFDPVILCVLHRRTRVDTFWSNCNILAFPKRQILDSSKLRRFADDNFKVDENGGWFS